MAEDQRVPSAPNQSLKSNQIMLVGRLDRCTKNSDGKFDHLLTLAAADEFSMPSVVRLVSSRKLADSGELVKCLSSTRGIPNNFELTKGERAGEKVFDARCWFVAVE